MKQKIKNLILILLLSLTLVGSSPLAVFATEAQSAPEAETAQEAQSAPEAEVSPSEEPEQVVEDGANEAEEANEAQDIDDPSDAEDADGDDYNWDSENNGDEDVNDSSSASAIDGANHNDNTGNQDGSGNNGNTSIDTGDATATGVVQNSVNTTTLSNSPNCTACLSSNGGSITNSENGTGSNNSATINDTNNSTVAIVNYVTGTNNANFDSNTGNNDANKNTGGDTEITTGDANVSATVITSANQTGLGIVEYDVVENHVGDIILTLPDDFFGTSTSCSTCPSASGSVANTGNGSDSTNTGTINTTNNNTTTIDNDANVINNLTIDANTGYNEASKNTGGDSTITTGDVNVAANLVNVINSTVTDGVIFVVNIFGDLVGDIIFPDNLFAAIQPSVGGISASNIGNGSESDNLATINTTNNNTINIDNYAYIENHLIVDAETGSNSVSDNTNGDNSIETGDIFVNAEILNIANINMVGVGNDEPLWIILVNNMGTWSGKIIGAITGTNYSGSQGLLFGVGADGEITATNQDNGAGSTNTANINSENSNTINIDNNANLLNNLDIDANTGGNSANKNTGGNSSITTGDVNIAASVINFVNSNFVGRKVMLGIINVFGSWTGDAVPPGQEPEAQQETGGSNASASQSSSSSNSSNTTVALQAVGGAVVSGVLGSFAQNNNENTNGNAAVSNGNGNSNSHPQNTLTITPLNMQAGGVSQDLRLILALVSAAVLATIFVKRFYFLR